MNDRASELIELLDLQPHPEGGHFREVFRSPQQVFPTDGRPPRAAITAIYFLLRAGEVSRLHRVLSDEVWHFYEGDSLELFQWDANFNHLDRVRLGPVDEATRPIATMPAGCWQAARTSGQYTLIGCTVGPGFDFEDFALLRDDVAAAEAFCRSQPEWAESV